MLFCESIRTVVVGIMVESKKTYGAIEEGHNEHYDEKNTYYLNESRFDWNRFVRLVRFTLHYYMFCHYLCVY